MKNFRILLATLLLIALAVPDVFADTWDGSATSWTRGSGTSADPYLIECAAHLAYLQEMVNGGVSTYSGKYFKMTTNINLNSRAWDGIGTSSTICFKGIFDGGGHCITRIKATSSALFKYIDGASIKNLSTGGSGGAGIVLESYGTVTVDNCHSAVTVISSDAAGGIISTVAGGKVTITNCSNSGNITANASNGNTAKAGGIIGLAGGTNGHIITNCHNAGSIRGNKNITSYNTYNPAVNYNSAFSGGIVGSNTVTLTITACYNRGDVSSKIMYSYSNTNYHSTSLTQETYSFSGGMIGYANCSSSFYIDKSYNSGPISAEDTTIFTSCTAKAYSRAGGIVGWRSSADINIKNCYNTKDVYAHAYCSGASINPVSRSAGISDYANTTNCYNTGTLTANTSKAGISNGTVSNCYYLETCGSANGEGTSKSAMIMKSTAFPAMLNASEEVFCMDLTPNVNDGYPIFGFFSVCEVNTDAATNVGFTTATLNGSYTLGEYWPSGTPDVQGFAYKKSSASTYDTVYANNGNPMSYSLSGLENGTTYKYKAFVTKNGLTICGSEQSFTTRSCSTALSARIDASATMVCDGDTATFTAVGSSSYSENFAYVWNTGQNTATIHATQNGTYTVSVTDDNGCSVSKSVTLTVNPKYGDVPVAQTICDGETLNFFGTILTTAGTYIHNGTTFAGCDSIVNLTLTVNPQPSVAISGNTAFCEGQNTTLTVTGGSSYLWNNGATTSNITINNGGTYSVTVTDANGCSSTASQTVTANPLPNITISGDTSYCQGGNTMLQANGADNYMWSTGSSDASIQAYNAGTYTVTGTNANGCSNIAAVSVIENPIYNISVAESLCQADSYDFCGQTLTTGGVYSHTLLTTSGCDSVISLTLTVNPLPTATISGETSFCEGQSTTLTATGGVSYLWNDGTTTQNHTVSDVGTYSVTVTDANGCTGTASQTVTMKTLPTITISGDTTFCEGRNATLTALGGASFVWSNGLTNASISVYTSGSYSVTGTGDNGCSNMAVAVVTVNPMPTISISGNTSFCQGSSTILTASGADSYIWNNGTTAPSVTIDAFGIYNVTGTTAAGCTGSASVMVTVSSNPTITITGDTELCPGETTMLTANGGTRYIWFDGSSSATYQTSTAGNYSVIGYNDAGCYSMVSVDVQQYDNAQTEETATGAETYLWNGENYTESGDYTYTTTTAHGCDSTVTLHLTIEQEGGQGIADVIDDDDVKVYAKSGRIMVEFGKQQAAVCGSSILVYDVMGRVLKREEVYGLQEVIEIPVTSAGVYMVKIGDRKPHKVVAR